MSTIARHLVRGRRSGSAALAVALALAIAVAGCGAGGAQGPRASSSSTAGAAAASPRGELTPTLAPAPAYGAHVGKCSGAVLDKVVADLKEAAKRAGRPPVTADDAVCAVAETFLKVDPGEAPRPQVLAFVSQWFGLPTQVLPPSSAVMESENPVLIADRIVQAIGNAVLNAYQPRLGIATQRVKRDATKVVVVLLDAPIEINPPFPRRLELGQKATLTGRLLAGLTSPTVQVSDATGRLSNPEQPPGDAFRADLACADRPGRILVDVRGEKDGKSGLVASFPVACGADLPKSISLAPEPWPTDPVQGEKKILEAVNDERTAAGLGPLKWDDGVADIARAISDDIAARGGSAGGDVGDRLKRAGIASPLVLQSAAADRSLERAHERLLASPSNRANIMNRDVTHAGIGVVVKPDAQGKPTAYVTEIFTKELPPADIAKTRADLKAAVAQKRRDARMAPLHDDPLLDDVAQKYAEAAAAGGGNIPKEKQSEITAPLNRTMRTLTVLSGAKPEPLDFAEEPQVTAVARSLGVGVAQGMHPVLGRNTVYVVIMVGTPKSEAEPAKAPVKGSRKGSGAKQQPSR